MRIFFIAFSKAVKQHIRDITPFILQVLSTIIIIIILGTTLRGNFSTNYVIKPRNIAVVNEDRGKSSKKFISYLSNDSLDSLLKINIVGNSKYAQEALHESKFDGVIVIKENYSERYFEGKYDGIETYIINNDKITFQILSSIINGWGNTNSAIQIALKNGEPIDSIIATLRRSDKIIVDKPLSVGGKLPKAMDYYTVTMVVMTLIFTGFNAMGRLQVDFLSEMGYRLRSSPINIGNMVAGGLMGTTFMGFLQMVLVVLFSYFVYGANLGDNLGIFFGTLFLMTFFGQMLAATLTLGLKDVDAPQAIIGLLGLLFVFLSGGLHTNFIGGSIGKFFKTYGTPNSLAQTAMFGSMYGGNSKVIFMSMGILATLSLLFLGLTIIFARRKVL